MVFDELFRTHYPRLYLYALHITGSDEDSRDIVTDVFTSVWKNIATLSPTSIKAYLNTGVRNRSVDYLRRNVLKTQYSEEYVRMADEYYSDYSDSLWKDRLVETMLHSLPPHLHRTLQLKYQHGKKNAEIAHTLGISPETVKKHVTKGLKILKEMYKDTPLPE